MQKEYFFNFSFGIGTVLSTVYMGYYLWEISFPQCFCCTFLMLDWPPRISLALVHWTPSVLIWNQTSHSADKCQAWGFGAQLGFGIFHVALSLFDRMVRPVWSSLLGCMAKSQHPLPSVPSEHLWISLCFCLKFVLASVGSKHFTSKYLAFLCHLVIMHPVWEGLQKMQLIYIGTVF